jgi:DNA-binding protein YbaB
MAENMDFTISTENLDSDENLDLNDDFEIVCSQQPRDEMKMAEDGIKRMTELNKRRYPLLTMKTLLEFQKKHNIKSGLLVIQFNGPKTNNEVSTDINKMVKPAVDSLQDSIISVLKEHIDKLNNKINSTYAETLETIGIYTVRRGEARNLMSRKSREINMDYEKRLKN